MPLNFDSTLSKNAKFRPDLVQLRFYGLSTETKPRTGADDATLPAPCEFIEIDTGETYWWDGYQWRPPVRNYSEQLLEKIERHTEKQAVLLEQLTTVLAAMLN